MLRIQNPLPQHLIAAANTDDRYALFVQLLNGFFIPMLSQIQQILYCIFTARQNDKIRLAQRFALTHIAHSHIRFGPESVEIRKIADLRRAQHRHVNFFALNGLLIFQRNRVLVVNA